LASLPRLDRGAEILHASPGAPLRGPERKLIAQGHRQGQ
jgi:hypothetical protein